MASIEDHWFRSRPSLGGKRARKPCHGTGKRRKVYYTDPDGRQRSQSFDRRVDAERFVTMREKLRIRAEMLASDGDGIDLDGWYVYLLWEIRDDKPVNVGSFGNILARLGAHLGDGNRIVDLAVPQTSGSIDAGDGA